MRYDIARYLDSVGRLDDGDIDYDAFRQQPLAPDVLRVLRYMHDVESHTVCYQRDLLVTRAHNDPDVTAFLTMWAYEEHWHGVAIGKVLQAHGEAAGAARIAPVRARRRDALGTLASGLSSMLTPHITAVHMCWGAINEWTTQAAYVRLAELAEHPVLATLVRRIAKQEGRHIDFYASQAEERLAARRARTLARAALRRFWAPVGSGLMPTEETDHIIRTLFAGESGLTMAQRIDRRVDRLPGLSGLGLVTEARAARLAA